MARPKAFNEEEVLDKAVEVFWAKGYEATSMQDLVNAMGIQRGSLYAAFGSKQQLFLRSLDRYGSNRSDPLPPKAGFPLKNDVSY